MSLVAAALFLGACQVGPTLQQTEPADYFLRATPDRAWNAIVLAFTDLGIPIETMERASLFMRSGEVLIARGDAAASMDCGTTMGMQLAGSIDVYVRMTMVLRQAGDSTALHLALQARGWDQSDADLRAEGNVFAGDPNKRCVSNGHFENLVIANVTGRLAAP